MADGEGGGSGKLIKIIIIAVVLLLLIGGGAIAAYFLLNAGGEDEESAGMAPATSGKPQLIEEPVYLPMGTFIVNLADGRRYLKTNMELLLTEPLAKVYLETRLSEVKDLVVSELQTLNSEQLRDPAEKELLKQRLMGKIESLLPTKDRKWDDARPIRKVLITEFYLQ